MVYMVRVRFVGDSEPHCFHFSHKREAYRFANFVSVYPCVSSVSVLHFGYVCTDSVYRRKGR